MAFKLVHAGIKVADPILSADERLQAMTSFVVLGWVLEAGESPFQGVLNGLADAVANYTKERSPTNNRQEVL